MKIQWWFGDTLLASTEDSIIPDLGDQVGLVDQGMFLVDSVTYWPEVDSFSVDLARLPV